MQTQPRALDALVIGAGPAGIGTALALAAVEDLRFGVIDRGEIGQTFLDWPRAQTFLTPSFTANGFGATDLNAIHPKTSPAYTLGVDYPNGRQYAKYLRSVAHHFELPVLRSTEATHVRRRDTGFEVETSRGPVLARTLVWAGGEFHAPEPPRIAGLGLVDHSSDADAWRPREGRLVVIGGYESGVDIACHHVERGSRVAIADRATPWDAATGADPSFRLAPRSRMRLEAALATGRLELLAANALRVKPDGDGFAVALDDGTRAASDSRPVAATGFGPGLGPVAELFERREDGWPLVDEEDQSTIAPDLFLAGPSLRHGEAKFCFVYKFRQRFAHVARVIGERLGRNVDALEAWREAGMLTEDLASCDADCEC